MTAHTTPADPNAMPATMCSREIALRTGKEHKNVLADIRKMLADIGKAGAEFSAVAQVPGPNGSTRTVEVFNLPKRECLILVSGYSVELRAAIIDRWQELEASSAPQPINVRDIGQLSKIALQLIEVNQELTQRAEAAEAKVVEVEVKVAEAHAKIDEAHAKIEADKPKTGFFDRFMNADGVFGLQNAGRILVEPPNKFIRWLKEGFLFYQGGCLVPRAQYRSMGIFEVKATMVDDKARYQTYVTPKGLRYLAKKLGKDIPDLEAGA